MRKFHLGDVLSITTGVLVAPSGVQGIYDILGYMTGESLFTHQLLRASDECKPSLLEQFPQLAEVDAGGVTPENHEAWLAEQVARYGADFEVKPLPTGAHEVKDPIAEAEEMFGKDKVILVPIK